MGIFKNVMIFSDIDGTFLGKKSVTVPRNMEAIRRFTAEGGLFTFATGRMEKNLPYHLPYVKELVSYPVLLNNGTCLYDFAKGCSLHDIFMEEAPLREFLAYAVKAFPDVGLRATAPGTYLYEVDNPIFRHDFGITIDNGFKKLPISEWDLSRIYKIVFRDTAQRLVEVRREIEPLIRGIFEITLAGDTILEVQPKNTSKGAAIDMVRRTLQEQGTPRRIFCIGDHENDLDMLRMADVAACPSNALDSVKALCTLHLCDHHEGAVADLIEAIERTPEYLAKV